MFLDPGANVMNVPLPNDNKVPAYVEPGRPNASINKAFADAGLRMGPEMQTENSVSTYLPNVITLNPSEIDSLKAIFGGANPTPTPMPTVSPDGLLTGIPTPEPGSIWDRYVNGDNSFQINGTNGLRLNIRNLRELSALGQVEIVYIPLSDNQFSIIILSRNGTTLGVSDGTQLNLAPNSLMFFKLGSAGEFSYAEAGANRTPGLISEPENINQLLTANNIETQLNSLGVFSFADNGRLNGVYTTKGFLTFPDEEDIPLQNVVYKVASAPENIAPAFDISSLTSNLDDVQRSEMNQMLALYPDNGNLAKLLETSTQQGITVTGYDRNVAAFIGIDKDRNQYYFFPSLGTEGFLSGDTELRDADSWIEGWTRLSQSVVSSNFIRGQSGVSVRFATPRNYKFEGRIWQLSWTSEVLSSIESMDYIANQYLQRFPNWAGKEVIISPLNADLSYVDVAELRNFTGLTINSPGMYAAGETNIGNIILLRDSEEQNRAKGNGLTLGFYVFANSMTSAVRDSNGNSVSAREAGNVVDPIITNLGNQLGVSAWPTFYEVTNTGSQASKLSDSVQTREHQQVIHDMVNDTYLKRSGAYQFKGLSNQLPTDYNNSRPLNNKEKRSVA